VICSIQVLFLQSQIGIAGNLLHPQTGFLIVGFRIEDFVTLPGLQDDQIENMGLAAVKPIMQTMCVQYCTYRSTASVFSALTLLVGQQSWTKGC